MVFSSCICAILYKASVWHLLYPKQGFCQLAVSSQRFSGLGSLVQKSRTIQIIAEQGPLGCPKHFSWERPQARVQGLRASCGGSMSVTGLERWGGGGFLRDLDE